MIPGGKIVALAVCLVAGGGACVSTSGTLQTADTAPAGDWQVGVGSSVPVSTRFVADLGDLAEQSVDEIEDGEPVTAEEEREGIRNIIGILLFQPSPVVSLSARRGISANFDVGFRLAGPAARLDGKWRFARLANGKALAFNWGWTHHTGIGSSIAEKAFDLFESLKLVSYSRKDADASLLFSTDGSRIVSWFAAARTMAAFCSFETELDDAIESVEEAGLRDTSETMFLVGGSGGIRFGTRRFALLAELTVMRLFFEPEILGARTDLGGWLIEPGVGLSAQF